MHSFKGAAGGKWLGVPLLVPAVVLIYAVLAAQFRSFLQPVTIMFSLVGVAGMLHLIKETLDSMFLISPIRSGVTITLPTPPK